MSATGAAHQVQVQVSNSFGSSVFALDLEEVGPPRVTYSSTALTYYRRDAVESSAVTPTIAFCKGGCTFSSASFPGLAGPSPATGFALNASTGKVSNSVSITTKISTGTSPFSIIIEDNSTPVNTVTIDDFTIEEVCNASGTPFGIQEFGGGGGVDLDPWLLCTPDHIKEISLNVASLKEYYKLSADIDFRDTDLPVYPIGVLNGIPVDCFSGGLDGNDYIISNFKVFDPASPSNIGPYPITVPSGLFSCLTDFDYIRDLTLINFASFSQAPSGSLAGVVTMPVVPVKANNISNVNSYRSYVRTMSSMAGGLIGSLECQSNMLVTMVNNISPWDNRRSKH